MFIIKEDILKLPRDEKIEILHSLQEDLENGDFHGNEGVSEEIWAEVRRREAMVANGETVWVSKEEIVDFVKQKIDAL